MADADKDDALLRRFNALKNSSTNTQPGSASSNLESTPLDLADRFRQLGSRTPSGSPESPKFTPDQHISAPLLREPSTKYNTEDDKTLEELLDDLGPDEPWKIDPNVEEENMKNLLEEARAALGNTNSETVKTNVEVLKSSHKEEQMDGELEMRGGETVDKPPGQNAIDICLFADDENSALS